MPPIFEVLGPEGALHIIGVRLVGFNAANGRKLLLTAAAVVALLLCGTAVRRVASRFLRTRDARALFWSHQAINLGTTAVLLIVLVSIWFDDPRRLATAFGLVSAGLAFALQKVVTAVAGYFIILRGRLFNIGDRISMGGVRGDVIALGYTRTTVMEMGQPPSIEIPDPGMWVAARQYTGRIVTITNDKVFSEPIYNYTRAFPYLWEEISVPVRYPDDRMRAEEILLRAAEKHTEALQEAAETALDQMAGRFFVQPTDLRPRAYLRLTSNWLELTVRFLAPEHGVRELKDAISREILAGLEKAGIQVASATYELVGLPRIQVATPPAAPRVGENPATD